jgi:hypothetical protein
LLNFQSPLAVVADEWALRRADVEEISFSLHSVCDHADAHHGDYELMPGVTADSIDSDEYAGRAPKEHGKSSALSQLEAAKKQVKPSAPGTGKHKETGLE